jgi:hypothetical protein
MVDRHGNTPEGKKGTGRTIGQLGPLRRASEAYTQASVVFRDIYGYLPGQKHGHSGLTRYETPVF